MIRKYNLFEYEANHRYLQLSCFRDESTVAAGAPGAPKKAARPVVENTWLDAMIIKSLFALKERDLAAMTEEEQIAYAMQVIQAMVVVCLVDSYQCFEVSSVFADIRCR